MLGRVELLCGFVPVVQYFRCLKLSFITIQKIIVGYDLYLNYNIDETVLAILTTGNDHQWSCQWFCIATYFPINFEFINLH